MNILVTDGENRSALAVTRSLARSGCRVVVTGNCARNLASSSRYCAASRATPDPVRAGLDYARSIAEIARTEEIGFIFPMTEASICILNQARELLPAGTVLACATTETMNAVADKVSLCRRAEGLGIPVPRSLYLQGPDELEARLPEIERYPVVVKPALSNRHVAGSFIPGRVRYARSRQELQALYAREPSLAYPSMVQELIVGPGTGLFTLYDGHRHLALFSHRRLREKPPSGGVSVVCESVPLDEEMILAADRLLAEVGWAGVAMVEFKRDLRDGRARLMEVNGRFWGSLQLAIACGVDFPALYLALLQGGHPAPFREYRVGHKLKWFLGTLDHLAIRLRNSGEALNLAPGAPSRWQALADFLKVWEKDCSFDVFDRSDPRPAWCECRDYLRQLLGSAP